MNGNLSSKKNKQSSRSNSKKRQASTTNTNTGISIANNKQSQIHKLLSSFTKVNSTKSRTQNDKTVYGGTKLSSSKITDRAFN
ncbi:MAG: hypothetical protein ACMG6E_05140 [Candidatus Roizmanbacteria bacterium]